MSTEILKPTWATWDAFDLEYDAWKNDYMASPASAGKFFSGGEILPDGSTVLEDYTYETFTASTAGTGSIPYNVELYDGHSIPRSRTDMARLYAFDHQNQTRRDLKGTRIKELEFYKQYMKDIEDAERKDKNEVDHWIDTFKRLGPQMDED